LPALDCAWLGFEFSVGESFLFFLDGCSVESCLIFGVKLTRPSSSAAFALFRSILFRLSIRRIASSDSSSEFMGEITIDPMIFLSCDFFIGS
jgi:hypothetical protein